MLEIISQPWEKPEKDLETNTTELNRSRQLFGGEVDLYICSGSEDLTFIGESGSDLQEAFSIHLRCIIEQPITTRKKALMIQDAQKYEARQRVELLNKLAGEPILSQIDFGSLEDYTNPELLQYACLEEEDYKGWHSEEYLTFCDLFEADIEQFLRHINEQRIAADQASLPEQAYIKVTDAVIPHISTGIAIGTTVFSALRRII